MATFRIYFETGASVSVEVEADDLNGAIDLAYEQIPSNVCAQCSGWGRGYSLELGGDWDASDDYMVDGQFIEAGAK